MLALVVSNAAMAGCMPVMLSRLGIHGAPLALVLQRWIGVVALLASLQVTKNHNATWFGWSKAEALDWSGIKEFLRQGLPSCVALFAEMLG